MATTSPPKPWQASSTGASTTAVSPVANGAITAPSTSSTLTTTSAATSNANSRLRPWEREASGGRIDDYSTASAVRRPYDSSYDSAYSNTPYSNSRYGSTYGSRYGGGAGGYGSSSYGSGYGGYGSGYGSSYGGYGSGGYGSGYGSSYGSSYGAGSSYGGYGSSYGSGYGDYGYGGGGYGGVGAYGGGYGGGVGGYGGPDAFGKYGPPMAGRGGFLGWRGAADHGFQLVNGLHSVTANFGRFAGLLDANSQAMHGALSSIVRLIENAGFLYREIGFALSGFTLVRLIQRLVRKMLGRASTSNSATGASGAMDAVNEFQKETQANGGGVGPTRFWLTFLVAIASFAFFGIPILNRALSRWLGPDDEQKQMESAWDPSSGTTPMGQMRAMHDYPAQSEHELTLRQGDVITVTRKPFEAWWEGEVVGQPGRLGLFPTNYTQPINPPSDPQP